MKPSRDKEGQMQAALFKTWGGGLADLSFLGTQQCSMFIFSKTRMSGKTSECQCLLWRQCCVTGSCDPLAGEQNVEGPRTSD